jgi:hypothetical protein
MLFGGASHEISAVAAHDRVVLQNRLQRCTLKQTAGFRQRYDTAASRFSRSVRAQDVKIIMQRIGGSIVRVARSISASR